MGNRPGRKLWSFDWITFADVNAADPILSGTQIFLSSCIAPSACKEIAAAVAVPLAGRAEMETDANWAKGARERVPGHDHGSRHTLLSTLGSVPDMSIYLELTEEFNRGRLRAVLSSGQAVVFHQLAVMSKDGDWILREDEEALGHVLGVLGRREARYRFGAPLDLRWLRAGWSSHFEFRSRNLRVRTDFVTRPPRLMSSALAALWQDAEAAPLPVIGVRDLCELKKTNRERDYAVIGELARLLDNPRDQLLFSRSARDLARLAEQHPGLVRELSAKRPVLADVGRDIQTIEAALDAERRRLIHANEDRLRAYLDTAMAWRDAWPGIADELDAMPLDEAHRVIVARAEGILPFVPAGEDKP